MGILFSDSVPYDRVLTSVSSVILKPPLRVIGAIPLKPQVFSVVYKTSSYTVIH